MTGSERRTNPQKSKMDVPIIHIVTGKLYKIESGGVASPDTDFLFWPGQKFKKVFYILTGSQNKHKIKTTSPKSRIKSQRASTPQKPTQTANPSPPFPLRPLTSKTPAAPSLRPAFIFPIDKLPSSLEIPLHPPCAIKIRMFGASDFFPRFSCFFAHSK